MYMVKASKSAAGSSLNLSVRYGYGLGVRGCVVGRGASKYMKRGPMCASGRMDVV